MRATPAVADALTGHVALALFYEGAFAGGTFRLWTVIGPIAWAGRTWTGAGTLLGFSSIEETSDVVANGTAIALSGVPSGLVQAAIAEARQGLPGRIWLAVLDAEGVPIPDPVLIFSGRLDVPEVSAAGETATITIAYESRLIEMKTAREWRYTHESQQTLAPGDRGFEFVTSIQDKDIRWGRA